MYVSSGQAIQAALEICSRVSRNGSIIYILKFIDPVIRKLNILTYLFIDVSSINGNSKDFASTCQDAVYNCGSMALQMKHQYANLSAN